jgi:hypothetical protein
MAVRNTILIPVGALIIIEEKNEDSNISEYRVVYRYR